MLHIHQCTTPLAHVTAQSTANLQNYSGEAITEAVASHSNKEQAARFIYNPVCCKDCRSNPHHAWTALPTSPTEVVAEHCSAAMLDEIY